MSHYSGMKNYPFRVKKKGRRMWRNLRHRAPKLIRGSILMIISCASLLLLGVIGYLLYHSPLFRVKEIRVYGCERLQKDRLVELADLKGRNVLSLALRQVARRIKQESWIGQVVVKRALPDRIEIYLKERRAVALINLNTIYLIDDNGVVFRKVRNREYFDLPVFTGLNYEYLERDPQKSSNLIRQGLDLISLLNEMIGLSPNKISEIHIDPDLGFSLFDTESATQFKLGLSDFREKLDRFKKVREIMDKERTPRIIDLRYKDKIIVTLDETNNATHYNKEVKKNG